MCVFGFFFLEKSFLIDNPQIQNSSYWERKEIREKRKTGRKDKYQGAFGYILIV